MDKKKINSLVKEALREELKKGIKVGGKTSYVRNDQIHISAATPKVRLEGTESGAVDKSIKEDAGAIQIFDEPGAARDYNIYPKGEASTTLPIPAAGGSATGTITATDLGLSVIDYIIDFRVVREAPVVDDVYEPTYGIIPDGSAVGITLAAGTGTTLTAEVEAIGEP